MPGRPKARLRTLEAKAKDGTATKKDLSDIEKLKERLAERAKVRAAERKTYRDPDTVEQVGGGLAVNLEEGATADDLLANMVPHQEVWNRLWVDPKQGGGLIPFRKTFWQKELTERLRERRRRRKPTKMVIVKGRQFGTTTGTAADCYSELVSFPGVSALAVTYKKALERVLPIATTYRTFIESDPLFKEEPPEYYSVNNWKGANGSSIQFHIAGEALARGSHYRWIHGTEVDFWPDFDETCKGMMQTVADHWTSVVIFETTLGDRPSIGLRNLIAAIRDGKNTEWELWFQEWWKFPEYKAGHPSNSYDWNEEIERNLVASMTIREKELERLGVGLSALEWRRRTIMAKCMGSEDTFAQEYPATLEEALEFRGSWFFNRAAIKWHAKNIKECEMRMRVWCEDRDYHIAPYRPEGTIADPARDPFLRIWEAPSPEKRYRLGADVAASEDLSAARSDMTIIDVETGKVVARWWGNVPAHKFGQAIHAAAMYYGGAACEVMFDRTGVGAAVIGELERLGTPNVAKGTQNRLGFHFTQDLKAQIFGTLQQLIDSCSLSYHCDELHRQIGGFTGETKDAGWVDAVVSLALACYRLPEAIEWVPAMEPEFDAEPVDLRNGPLTIDQIKEIREAMGGLADKSQGYLYDYS